MAKAATPKRAAKAPDAAAGAAADAQPRAPARAQALQGEQGRAARILPADAADPPLRGARRPALRARPDRRLLPSLYRPGGGRGRAAVGARAGQGQRHHRLSRPRPHARLRHRSQGDHGRADRPRRRHLQGQGRLDAHVQRRAQILRRPRHRRRPGQPRHRPRLQHKYAERRRRLPRLFRRRRRQSGPGLRELQHGRAVEAADHLRDREQPICDGHQRQPLLGRGPALQARRIASASPASRSTAWTCSRCAAPPRPRSNGCAAARGRSCSS